MALSVNEKNAVRMIMQSKGTRKGYTSGHLDTKARKALVNITAHYLDLQDKMPISVRNSYDVSNPTQIICSNVDRFLRLLA